MSRRPKTNPFVNVPQAAPLPYPMPTFEPLPRPKRAKWKWIFGGLYAFMMIVGFETGFKAGTSKPTPHKKPVMVAAAKPTSTITKPDPDPSQPEATPAPKAKTAEPKVPESPKVEPKTPEPKEPPDPKPMPEVPPAKKPEPKPEMKPEPKPEPKPVAKTPPKAGMEVTFVSKIGPIFKDKCGVCHGGANAKGGLDLRSAKSSIMGGDSGAGIAPGDPDGSAIWQSIMAGTMPPKGKTQLTADEKKLIKEWIAGGAK